MPGQSIAARNLTIRSHFGAERHALSLPILQFALFQGDPSGGGIEPSGGGYGRVAVNNDAAFWGTFGPTDVFAVNKAGAVVFPQSTGPYTITTALDWWAIYDSTSGGSLWYWGPLGTTITVVTGDVPRIPANSLVCAQVA